MEPAGGSLGLDSLGQFILGTINEDSDENVHQGTISAVLSVATISAEVTIDG